MQDGRVVDCQTGWGVMEQELNPQAVKVSAKGWSFLGLVLRTNPKTWNTVQITFSDTLVSVTSENGI